MPSAALLAVTLAAAAASVSVVAANVNSSSETAESQTIESGDQIYNVSENYDAYDDRHNDVSEEVEYEIYEIDDPG